MPCCSRSAIQRPAARFVADDAGFDRPFQPLRIGVGADRQGRAGQLQQAGELQVGVQRGLNSWIFGTERCGPWPGLCRSGARLVIAIMVMPAMRTVGARFRLERRFGFADRAAQAAHHLGQHVVGLEAQLAAVLGRQDLHRHVAVAEVVGGTGEEQRAVGDGLDQFFRRGEDFDDGACRLRPPACRRRAGGRRVRGRCRLRRRRRASP